MSPGPTESTAEERELLETAREGSEDAYRRLVEPHRSSSTHCYRMLGSVQDAEDAAGGAGARLARPAEVRGPQLAALLAIPDRDQHLA